MEYRYDPILCMNIPVKKSKAKDEDTFVQLRFASGRTEGAKLDPSSFREYAEALLKKYNEKQVTISKNGRALATYINRNFNDSVSSVEKAIKACDVKYTIVEYYDHAGKKHTSYKESEEEAKKWIDSGKFPQTVIYDVKINGKLYKKQIRT